MEFLPIKTRPFLPPRDNIFSLLDDYLPIITEGDVLFITSKIIAIHQGRCIHTSLASKKELIEQEADAWITTDVVPGKSIYLTVKNNILIPSAGIDESNANEHYILWPENLSQISKEIHTYIRQKHGITNIGIVITDSTTKPLKRGVVGIGIYSYGIIPVIDKRGEADIFGKKLMITQINVIDALCATAVYLMGEGAECQPLLIGRNIPGLQFTDKDIYPSSQIPCEQDLYFPLLRPLMEKNMMKEEKNMMKETN